MDLLRRDERKPACQIEAHLITEQRQRACAGPVVLADARLANQPQQVEIRLHVAAMRLPEGSRLRYAHHRNAAPSRIMGSDKSCPMVNQPPAR